MLVGNTRTDGIVPLFPMYENRGSDTAGLVSQKLMFF